MRPKSSKLRVQLGEIYMFVRIKPSSLIDSKYAGQIGKVLDDSFGTYLVKFKDKKIHGFFADEVEKVDILNFVLTYGHLCQAQGLVRGRYEKESSDIRNDIAKLKEELAFVLS